MAHMCCVSTTIAAATTSSLRLRPTSEPLCNLSLPRQSWNLRKIVVSSRGDLRAKAGNSTDYWVPPGSGRRGVWSIREDLEVPSSYLMGDPHVRADYGPPSPSPLVAERFNSVISQLFQHRIVRCGGPVDDDMANIIVSQLLYLDALDPTKDIIMYINSPGGSVTAGMAIFDTMRHIRSDVSTVCVGLAASMAAFLLSAGTTGKRYSLPNGRIMILQPIAGIQGQQTEVEIQGNEILHHRANLGTYLAYNTGQSIEKINEDTEIDFFMSPKEAKDYGLIDSVIMNPLKALPPLAVARAGEPTPASNGTADAVPPAE